VLSHTFRYTVLVSTCFTFILGILSITCLWRLCCRPMKPYHHLKTFSCLSLAFLSHPPAEVIKGLLVNRYSCSLTTANCLIPSAAGACVCVCVCALDFRKSWRSRHLGSLCRYHTVLIHSNIIIHPSIYLYDSTF